MTHHAPRRGNKNRHKERGLRRPAGATTALCGLIAFPDRNNARRAAQSMPWSDGRPREYKCADGCGLWHVGYLPELVVEGLVTVGEWYGHTGGTPMRDVLLPLLAIMRKRTHGDATFQRRTGADDIDLWSAMIDVPGVGQLVARDYDSPRDAAMAAIAEYRTTINQQEDVAA